MALVGCDAGTGEGTASSTDATTGDQAGGPDDAADDELGGTLTIGLTNLGNESADPSSGGPATGRPWWELTFDYLIGATPDGELSKDTGLASDWSEEINDDGSGTYTITLREGVVWHNGDPLVADDVKYSIEYMMREESRAINATVLRNLITSVEAPDEATVVLHTDQPSAFVLLTLSPMIWQEGMIVGPKSYLEEVGPEGFAAAPIGTGPFRFVEQSPGSSIRYEAVDDHWYWGTPAYDEVVLRLLPEESTRIADLQNGAIDVADVSLRRASQLQDTEGIDLRVEEQNTIILTHFYNMFEDGTHLADPRVREALNLAVDRQAIIDEILAGFGEPAASPVYGSHAYGYQPLEPYDYDPERAKEILAEAAPGGVALTMYSYDRIGASELPQINQAVAGMWEAVGVDVTLEPIQIATHFENWVGGELGNSTSGHNLFNQPFSYSAQPLWLSSEAYTVVHDDQLDQLIQSFVNAESVDAVGDLQHELASYARAQHYGVPIAEADTVYAHASNVPTWSDAVFETSMNLPELAAGGGSRP